MSESGIFNAVVKLHPVRRAAYLDQACDRAGALGDWLVIRGRIGTSRHILEKAARVVRSGRELHPVRHRTDWRAFPKIFLRGFLVSTAH
jgi:hypothetical protein